MGVKVKSGYKQTEVGVIPEDWDVVPMGSLGMFSKGRGISKDESDSGEIPCIRYGEIYTHHNDIIHLYNSFISLEVAKSSKKLKTGDILFAGSGETKEEIGKCVAFIDDIEAYAGGDIVILTLNKGKPQFFGYLFNAPIISRQKASKGQGDAVVHISSPALSSIRVPLPPTLAEQTAIATALSDADALIQSLERLIAKKRDIKQGAMQELLTGKKRLPGFEKKKGYKQTEVGVIPEDWNVTSIGGVSKIFGRIGFRGYTVNDIVKEGNGAITISPSNIQDNKTDFTNCTYISWKKYEESPEIKIENGDILLVKTGSTVGKTAIVQNLPERATVNPQIVVLKKIEIEKKFVGYSMGFVFIQAQLKATTVGGALPTLSQKQIALFKFPVPSTFSEQTAIATVLSDMDAEIAALEEKLAKARQIKQGMMQELLTGRIRLT
ncbi:MAG: restriction endonuclease subunit S [Methanophagales archaeon]|nr:restriction endonuclease subunit S [Methanophagales archaeon]